MSDQPGILQKTKDAITDPNETLDEKAPGSPFALVALSYLAVLGMGCVGLGLFLWISR